MANNALSESFDNGVGAISNAWNVDSSANGEVKLAGSAAMMEWATSPDAGHGYGTYTVTAKIDGNEPGAGIVLWPGDNSWPGQEIDMAEVTPDGSGRIYGTVHWNNNGSDAYNATIFDGVETGTWHTFQMVWEPGKITFSVDGAEKGVITDHVPADYDHGGMNNTIGFLNNNPNTSITVSDVQFTPLGGSTPAAESAPAAAPSEAAAPAAPAAAAASEAVSSTDTHSDAVDWNAIAKQLQDHFNATGSWDLGVGANDAPASVAATSDAIDWNQLAAQVNANLAAHGQWFI